MARSKIAVFAAIIFFACMALYSAWNDLRSDQRQLDDATLVESQLQDIIPIDAIITGLQKERGLTAIYKTNPNEAYASALSEQRKNTTAMLEVSAKTMVLAELAKKRNHLLHQMETPDSKESEVFQNYTLLIFRLLQSSEALVFGTLNTQINNSLILDQLLKNAQENAGQLQAKISTVLASKMLTDQDYQEIIAHNTLFHHQLARAQAHQAPKIEPLLRDMQDQSCFHETSAVIQNVIDRSQDSISLSPSDWFELSACAAEPLYDIADQNLKLIQIDASQIREEAKSALFKHLFFWIGTVLTLSLFLIISFKRSKELARGHRLLENYQGAIDYSTIVSKADKKGLITYVNRAFCEISGYSPKELLHQPHSIVRHPDMPKEVFKALWGDLKQGRKWNGIIKNLRKDGTAYWVDASISPIYDHKGLLVEYIAIRRDISDMIRLNEEIKDTQHELIYRMGEAVESRSKESGLHIQRVAHYSKLLAQVAGLNEEECETIFAASTMHDIGKISISDAVLLKEGRLNDAERATMKTHAEIGYKILEGSERPLLKMAATVAYEHHEHFDGNGYPRGIKGEEISIYGRIVAIADVFDALATDRIYKKAWPLEKILTYLKTQSGRQFDPELIELFINYLDQFIEIKNRFKEREER